MKCFSNTAFFVMINEYEQMVHLDVRGILCYMRFVWLIFLRERISDKIGQLEGIAALAKIYGIDEHELYKNPYYPRVPNY